MLRLHYLSETALAEQLQDLVLVCDVAPNRRQVDLFSVQVCLVFHDYIFNYNHLIKMRAFQLSQ